MNMAFPSPVENKGTVAENIRSLKPSLLPEYFKIFMQHKQPISGVPGFLLQNAKFFQFCNQSVGGCRRNTEFLFCLPWRYNRGRI